MPKQSEFILRSSQSLDPESNPRNWVLPGGTYLRANTVSNEHVAIIVADTQSKQSPDLEEQFLTNLHVFLKNQPGIDYTIYVIEQYGKGVVKRGMLYNVGFIEASKDRKYTCFIFHNMDLIPLDHRNRYTCYRHKPKLMVSSFKAEKPNLQYNGVISIKPGDFYKANGYSNLQPRRDYTHDIFLERMVYAGLEVCRSDVGKYLQLVDDHEYLRRNYFGKLHRNIANPTDGLSSTSLNYKLLGKIIEPLVTRIKVKINS